jgi:predicted amidohydrolase/GNAT superfamily N-acetyltransferase
MTTKAKRPKFKVRVWTMDDIPNVVACHRAAYPEYPKNAYYNERFYEMQYAAFPEGQYLAEADGQVVGYATSLIVQLDDDAHWYTYEEITGGGTFSTHDPSGDTLYGADIGVRPAYRRLGVSRALYEKRVSLMKRYNLRRMVAYGRIPGYTEFAGKMTAEEYVQKVLAGEIADPSLTAHMRAGYTVRRILLDFLWDDSSLNYSTLLEMPNPNYQPEKRKIAAAPLQRVVRRIRVCAAQWFMRPIHSWDEFAQTVNFFVDTANTYHSHFLLFPELFTAQLFTIMPPDLDSRAAIRRLASMTDRYIDLFSDLAEKHGLYIIAGSQPELRDGEIYNVAYLFTPSGQYLQPGRAAYPAHRTHRLRHRAGRGDQGLRHAAGAHRHPGRLRCRVPGVARLQTLSGAEIIFIPYSTDERKAFDRLRYTAQARAVENFIYTVIAGNTGNLPASKNYLINYGQAAVFTPSDFAFPPRRRRAPARPTSRRC